MANGNLNAQKSAHPSKYRAAHYSTIVDFSRINLPALIPELSSNPPGFESHKYYIQYGLDSLIEIYDPVGSYVLPVTIIISDNITKIRTTTCYYDDRHSYFVLTDTLKYSTSDNNGTIVSLCPDAFHCDSVKYVYHSSKKERVIHFDKNNYNLPSRSLYYPELQYLPTTIIDGQGAPIVLDEYIEGKKEVDALLSLFSYEGYTLISNDYFESIKRSHPEEVQRMNEVIQKMAETLKD